MKPENAPIARPHAAWADLRPTWKEALEHYKAKRWSDALGLFDSLADCTPVERRMTLYHYRIQCLEYGLRRTDDALALCRTALSEFPEWSDGWRIAGRMEERLGRTLRAFACYKQWLRYDATGLAAAAVVTILIERHHYGAAQRIIPLLGPQLEANPDLYLRQAELHIALKQPRSALDAMEEYTSRTGADVGRWRGLAEAQLQSANRLGAREKPRHLAIGGVSYIGSTALGIVLGSLPRFANIGESHWLTQRRDKDNAKTVSIDFQKDDRRAWHHCRICGARCQVLNDAFRSRLARDPSDWYDRIAGHLGVDRLVISDKTLAQYRRLEPQSHFHLVILYKSPTNHFRSHLRAAAGKEKLGVYVPDSATTVEKVLNNWVENYSGLLEGVSPTGKRIVLNWEQFVAQPTTHFERLLGMLELPGSAEVFQNIALHHFIGGSATGGVEELLQNRQFRVRDSSAPMLASELAAAVTAHNASQDLFQRMQALYAEQFLGV